MRQEPVNSWNMYTEETYSTLMSTNLLNLDCLNSNTAEGKVDVAQGPIEVLPHGPDQVPLEEPSQTAVANKVNDHGYKNLPWCPALVYCIMYNQL